MAPVNATGVIRLKRRAAGGAAGAPASLKSTEPAFNEANRVLYIGFGDDGNGNATSVIPIGGEGAFVTKAALDEALANTGAGDMLKSDYDPNGDGKVNSAAAADQVPWAGVQGKPTSFPPEAHSHDSAVAGGAAGFMSGADKQKLDGVAAGANNYVHPTSDGNRHVPATASGDVSKFLRSNSAAGGAPAWSALAKGDVGLGNVDNTSDANKPVSAAQQTALDLKANLNSPTFTGTVAAPTPAGGTNNTQIATTAFVQSAIQALIGMAPAELDTIAEIAARIQAGESDHGAIFAALAGKLNAASNLADVANAATAWGNLGGGSLGKQSADNVAITGGTISNVEIDGGTF